MWWRRRGRSWWSARHRPRCGGRTVAVAPDGPEATPCPVRVNEGQLTFISPYSGRKSLKTLSSAESVGVFPLRMLAEAVQQGQFRHGGGPEPIRPSRHEFHLVVVPL